MIIDRIVEKHRQMRDPAAMASKLRGYGLSSDAIDKALVQHREHLASDPFDEAAIRADLAGLSRVDMINRYLAMFDSFDRAGPLLLDTAEEPAEVFWPVMLDTWNVCDGIWPFRQSMLSVLRKRRAEMSPIGLMNEADRAFYDQLPDRVPIYRGCGRRRVRSLPWTTDREKAAFFASGGRFPTPRDPVVAEAVVDKADVFFVSTTRNEAEVVIDPYRLGRVNVVERIA